MLSRSNKQKKVLQKANESHERDNEINQEAIDKLAKELPEIHEEIIKKLDDVSEKHEKLSLKISEEKKKFIDSDIGNPSQTPTERLRQIDLMRLYTPLPEERKELRIPESIERLNLVEVKHLLLLCGGCAFVRFAPEVSMFSCIVS